MPSAFYFLMKCELICRSLTLGVGVHFTVTAGFGITIAHK